MKFQANIEADYEIQDVEGELTNQHQPAMEFRTLLAEVREAFPVSAKVKLTLRYEDPKGVWNVWRG